MSNNRLRNALQALSGGLTTIAQYRGMKEEKAEEREFQTETLERQQAFQERLAGKQMDHQSALQEKGFEHQSAEGEKDRLFRTDIAKMEMDSAERRHAQSMSAQYAGLRQQAEQFAAGREDKGLDRQLKVYEMGVEGAADQYTQLVKAMQGEMTAVAKDTMIIGEERKKAAADAIRESYAPQLAAAREEIDNNMRGYAEVVGAKLPEKPEAGGAEPAGGVDIDRIAQRAVESAGPAIATIDDERLKTMFRKAGVPDAQLDSAITRARALAQGN